MNHCTPSVHRKVKVEVEVEKNKNLFPTPYSLFTKKPETLNLWKVRLRSRKTRFLNPVFHQRIYLMLKVGRKRPGGSCLA
jgi:hypothetical protein